MLNKIEEKIGRIDFAKVDVDQLFKEWKGEFDEKAPIQVRLIMWLKENASAYGYEQSENSWVRKQ